MVGKLPGKHAPDEVKILPLDLASGEDSLKKAVEKAESLFPSSGVDYMIHNAAFERPVSDWLLYLMVRNHIWMVSLKKNNNNNRGGGGVWWAFF